MIGYIIIGILSVIIIALAIYCKILKEDLRVADIIRNSMSNNYEKQIRAMRNQYREDIKRVGDAFKYAEYIKENHLDVYEEYYDEDIPVELINKELT